MLTATPIITGHNIDWVTQPWVVPVMVVGGFLALIFGGLTLIAAEEATPWNNRPDPSWINVIFSAMIAVLGLVGVGAGLAHIVSNGSPPTAEGAEPERLHADALYATISNSYEITGIEFAGNNGGRDHDTGEAIPKSEELCAPVSTRSPEFTGIARGQQISFKVGITDCRSDDPTADIIVTKTPGQAISAKSLEKH